MNLNTASLGIALLLASANVYGDAKPATVTTLSFAPSASVTQFSPATATITVSSSNLPVTTGTVKLFQTKTSGVPGSCATQNGHAQVQPPLEGTPDVNGQITFDLYAAGLTGVVGTFGFIAEFSDPGTFSSSSSACLNLVVTTGASGDPLCATGQNATISATFVTSPGFPLAGAHTWNLLISVHACKDLTNVSAQGGKNAWTGATFGAPSKGSLAQRKATGGNNEVTIWTIGSLTTGTTVVLPVTVTGAIKSNTACGTVLGLLGSWSALSTSTELGSQKSEYSGTSTVTVGPDPCI
ncbi:MAG TPA: hypothetical protein VM120_21970 [Bryobacteraceae bacterium]|nr:hypothetical protein [Bryobacteraceae bacterium]